MKFVNSNGAVMLVTIKSFNNIRKVTNIFRKRFNKHASQSQMRLEILP